MTDLTTQLIARRHKVGAESPEGRRLSMTSEMLDNLPLADDDMQRLNLTMSLATTVRETERIKAAGGKWTMPDIAALVVAGKHREGPGPAPLPSGWNQW